MDLGVYDRSHRVEPDDMVDGSHKILVSVSAPVPIGIGNRGLGLGLDIF